MQRAFQRQCHRHISSHVNQIHTRLNHASSSSHTLTSRQSNRLRDHAYNMLQRCRRPAAPAAAADSNSNVQIGAELLAGRADAKAAMQWREATVLENR